MIDKTRRTYGAFTASYDYRTVSKFVRNTSRAFTLEYCAKTALYGAILEQNAHFRPIYGSLRRSVMIDLGFIQQAETNRLRIILSLFSIFNIIVVFVIYYGPMIINTLSIVNALTMLFGVVLNRFVLSIYIESLVILLSIIICFQTTYIISIVVCAISTRKFSKMD